MAIEFHLIYYVDDDDDYDADVKLKSIIIHYQVLMGPWPTWREKAHAVIVAF